MAAPINNGLQNISPAGLSSSTGTDSSVADGSPLTPSTVANATAAGSAGAAMRSLGGNQRTLPGAGQNIDWFSDLDAGSKLPIGISDRLQGKSIQEMTDIIMGHLGLRN